MGESTVRPIPGRKTVNSQYEEIMNSDSGTSSKASGMSAGIEHAPPFNVEHKPTGTTTTHPYKNPQNEFNVVKAKPNHKNQNAQ